MKLATMQPTYLPWAGYFNLIADASPFVFLDNVDFSPRSWQQRNRIILNGEPHMLTVPVLTKDRGRQKICDVQTEETQNWRKKHLGTLRRAYSRNAFGMPVVEIVESVLDSGVVTLADMNIELIRAFCNAMGMAPNFCRCSELQVDGSRSNRLLELCRHFQADTYLSPRGSMDYIEEDGIFAESGTPVVYQDFVPKPYTQRGVKEFVSHMSIVDVLANIGFEEGRKYVEQSI